MTNAYNCESHCLHGNCLISAPTLLIRVSSKYIRHAAGHSSGVQAVKWCPWRGRGMSKDYR